MAVVSLRLCCFALVFVAAGSVPRAALGSGSGCCWDAPVLLRLRVGLPGGCPRCCWVGGVVSGTVASSVSWHGLRPPVHATLLACPVSTRWATASISSCVCVLGAPKSGCSVAGACCSGCCTDGCCPLCRWLLLLLLGSGSSLAPLWGAAAAAVAWAGLLRVASPCGCGGVRCMSSVLSCSSIFTGPGSLAAVAGAGAAAGGAWWCCLVGCAVPAAVSPGLAAAGVGLRCLGVLPVIYLLRREEDVVVVRDFGPRRHHCGCPRCNIAGVALKQGPPILFPYDEEGVPSVQLHFSGVIQLPVHSSPRLIHLYEPRSWHERTCQAPPLSAGKCRVT